MSNGPSPPATETSEPQDRGTSRTCKDSKRRRVRHHKSRNGCYTCKLRRVKCDEVQPICGSCAFRGDQCSFPAPTIAPTTHGASHAAPRTGEIGLPLLECRPPESPTRAEPIHMADMSLLTRFMIRTSPRMSLDAKRVQAWQRVIPDIATQKDYLMHLLLTLAGEHALYEGYVSNSTTSRADNGHPPLPRISEHGGQLDYHRVIQHHQRGLEGFRQALADISPATAEDVFCGSILLVAIAFASISIRDLDSAELGLIHTDDHDTPYTDWLHLVRGLTSIVGEYWFTLKLGRLRSMLSYTYATGTWKPTLPELPSSPFPRLANGSPMLSVFAQGASQALHMLRSFATRLSSNKTAFGEAAPFGHPEADGSLHDHVNTLDGLADIYMRVLYTSQFSQSERDCPGSLDVQIDLEDSAITSWPQMLSDIFIASLKPSEQVRTAEGFSYVILAHFYLTLALFEDVWYFNRGPRAEIRKIFSLVERLNSREISALMAWPMSVIGEH
ncbi:hypothetical protein BO78DRAFT_465130 [Aspergillus sclerotiicarbonarius CBS 121057]|uniref:Zn(2)-C6 fungal-type domain-containing protein n=1 Tax=Aspergillus sclerotiicarbonarius (strain CBS 121057 / IBT 28362) TaxID=1448318 RepID=A0A319DSQ1_ASPSB|nr:hypothetical protein BO78DRAFT_465130 [Aspergillus sclerotiicarbonarius CBS 121057]